MTDLDRLIQSDPTPHLELVLQLAAAGKRYAEVNPGLAAQLADEAVSLLAFAEENFAARDAESGVQFFYNVEDRPRFDRLTEELRRIEYGDAEPSVENTAKVKRRRPGFPKQIEDSTKAQPRHKLSIFSLIRWPGQTQGS